MPAEEYESRSDSVLAWKKAQKLGRFDPEAPSIEEHKIRAIEREIDERGKFANLNQSCVLFCLSFSARPMNGFGTSS